MELVAIAILGGAAAVASASMAMTLERRMDVLYGPYIEGQAIQKTIKQKLLALASSFAAFAASSATRLHPLLQADQHNGQNRFPDQMPALLRWRVGL